ASGDVDAAKPFDPDAITAIDLAAAFRGFTEFGVPAPAPKGEKSPPTSLDAYEEQLLFLRDALQTHIDNPANPETLTATIQGARTIVQGMIAAQEVGWRPVFQSILWPPVDGVSMSLSQAVATGIGRGW